ncbi:hypothetical protein Taro_038087 [Colocasia esculenta]|uniref:Phosphoglycerate kinase n=1 Tax=Colocasia esculenta TaxID=4460 RepID=A0A843WCY0_COLES|nr:hypothetical protein [Colocasia esculenta]
MPDGAGAGLLSSAAPSPICSEFVLIEIFDGDASMLIHVQTLRNFPKEKLKGEVVAVRVDSTLMLDASCTEDGFVNKAIYTIKYLYDAGAKVILLSNWDHSSDPIFISTGSFAEHLSSILKLNVLPANGWQLNVEELSRADIFLLENLTRFKGEVANSLDFSKKLSAGVGIFVNDSFSLAHKILASTVGISRFCYSSVAGFHFEEELHRLTSIAEATKRPFIAIIGGGNFLEKGTALHVLALKCDGLMFVGKMAFQVMHALGMTVPMNLVEYDAVGQVLELIQLATNRNVKIFLPDDFWCMDNKHPGMMDIFPSDRILPDCIKVQFSGLQEEWENIMWICPYDRSWTPIDLGPVSLENISSRLSKCKKVLVVGPINTRSSGHDVERVFKMCRILERISETGCEVVVVGNASYKTFFRRRKADSFLLYKHFENASVVWEFLKGRKLPAIAALDRAYSSQLDWNSIFSDPAQPLVVDVGSGNGLFLFGMAKRWQTSNFLGLEINRKFFPFNKCYVYFPLHHFKLSWETCTRFNTGIVDHQCPNPDFNKTDHRWKMVQRLLVEAITELLAVNGKVFLQSDIEEVARRMKEEFMVHGKGKLASDGDDGEGWIKENPFGVRSDWERHVLDRGDPIGVSLVVGDGKQLVGDDNRSVDQLSVIYALIYR